MKSSYFQQPLPYSVQGPHHLLEHQHGAKYCLSFHFPSLFSTSRLLVALHCLYMAHSTSRTFSCLVSRNCCIQQTPANNKMAFSQLPSDGSEASRGHIVQGLCSQEDAACSPPTQDVVQEPGFATAALNSPKVTG